MVIAMVTSSPGPIEIKMYFQFQHYLTHLGNKY